MTFTIAALRRFWLGDQGLSTFLLLLFLALFLGPFIDSRGVAIIITLIFSLVMVTGVANMSHRVWIRVVAGIVACGAIAMRWVTTLSPTPSLLRWSSVASLLFMVLLTIAVLYRVFSESAPVTMHRVLGAIAAYLLLGITWSVLYGLLDQTVPNAFSHTAAGPFSAERQGSITYFSFVTLATLGYGDITPTHPVSRMFAVLEALLGQLYPATLLARLVSLEVSHRGS